MKTVLHYINDSITFKYYSILLFTAVNLSIDYIGCLYSFKFIVFFFQVVAREANGGAASAPLSLAVRLLDQNDNAPVIPKTLPITVPASLEPTAVHKVST